MAKAILLAIYYKSRYPLSKRAVSSCLNSPFLSRAIGAAILTVAHHIFQNVFGDQLRDSWLITMPHEGQ